jgi:hypothetical protein
MPKRDIEPLFLQINARDVADGFAEKLLAQTFEFFRRIRNKEAQLRTFPRLGSCW